MPLINVSLGEALRVTCNNDGGWFTNNRRVKELLHHKVVDNDVSEMRNLSAKKVTQGVYFRLAGGLIAVTATKMSESATRSNGARWEVVPA